MLVVAAIDILDGSFAVNHQRRRVRDVQRIHANQVIQPIVLGNHSVFIQKKRKRYRVLFQKLGRLEHAIPLLCSNERQLGPGLRNLVLESTRPEPCAGRNSVTTYPAETLRSESAPQKSRQSQNSSAIGGFQCKFRGPLSDPQSFRVVEHLGADCKSRKRRNNEGNSKRTRGDTVENHYRVSRPIVSRTWKRFTRHMPAQALPI